MKINYFVIFTLMFVVLISSCKKKNTTVNAPNCLAERIHVFDSTYNCAQSKVDQYIFQQNTVYVFDAGVCEWADMSSEVVDQDCNTIGYLGGFVGNGTINGEDFSNATYIKTVWHK